MQLIGVISELERHDLHLSALVCDLLASESPDLAVSRARLVSSLPNVLDTMARCAPEIVHSWVLGTSIDIYRKELVASTAKAAGFHANASNMQPAQVEQFNLAAIAVKLREVAPHLWELFSVLVDARKGSRRVVQRASEATQRVVDRGGDLGGEGDRLVPTGSFDASEMPEDPMDVDSEPISASAAAASDILAVEPGSLNEIRVITMLGIAQQSTNQRCNAIQANMGVFLSMTHTPDTVVSVLNHIGTSVSSSTLNSTLESLEVACERQLAQEGETGTTQEAYDNFNFKGHVAHPMPGNNDVFVSATSAIAIRSPPFLTKEDFRHARVVWAMNPANQMPRFPPSPQPFRASYKHVLALPKVLDSRRQILGPRPKPARLPYAPQERVLTNAWHVRRNLVTRSAPFAVFSPFLGQPDPVDLIPLHKTEYLPMRAMDLNQSTTSGNITALETMFKQINFPPDMADEYVTFVHADLGGCERIHAAQSDRCDEDRGIDQFKNVVDCPGLFHMKMATTDALYRTFLKKPAARHSGSSVWTYVRRLRPTAAEQAKFSAKSGPGYRRMHDVSRHITWALLLDCWTREAERWSGGFCCTLDDFARVLTKLHTRTEAWDIITQLSIIIAEKYVAGPQFYQARSRSAKERDGVFEYWQQWLSQSLLDEELDISVKNMDVGRVQLTLFHWMFIFRAAGKHKYAHHTLRVLLNIAYVFPKPLARAFVMSWIINPSGKPGGGRGVDWLVELFNLYLKNVHSGSSSNFGLKRIIKISTLISLFKFVFDNFITNYHILSRTVRHAPPNMTEAISLLQKQIHSDNALQFTPGRVAPYEAPDAVSVGQAAFMEGDVGDLASAAAAEEPEERESLEVDDYYT